MGKQGKKVSQQMKRNSGEVNKITPTKENVKKRRKLEAASVQADPLPSTSSQGERKQKVNVRIANEDIRLIEHGSEGQIGANNNAVIGEQLNLFEHNYATRSKPLDEKLYNTSVKNVKFKTGICYLR